ncbi:FeoA family protein [Chloroflexus sp.]|uniref:FeoA family protein n=1 Tax=Chloroflexus sp. TaxID=1904827 RepID=UPI00298EEC50|nr:FeoA family protein [Chloroflexus sp.]MCS6887756.1 ferrous iron transport protein A [Chloroflexus sp.]MCX7861176.1 ferrous iron transport protein A [Chloroflexus sp.]MDW8405982.1 FeoA family protein [Chloroflexus sp.]
MKQTSHPIPLRFVQQGARAKLVGIQSSQRMSRRLSELGFVPGIELSVIADSGSALMIALGDSRMAIEYPLAHALLVTVVEHGAC